MESVKKSGQFTKNDKKQNKPSFDNYATVESICNNIPVYSLNNIIYIYGESPDFYPGVVSQEDNTNPVVKVKPKKSWEIKHNFAGAEHEMTCRTAWNDSQPFLPIHLIDGNADTVWCSWGCAVPDGRLEWIRIDLPVEGLISSISLVCTKNFKSRGYAFEAYKLTENKFFGNSLPREIEVKISRDAWHWETVFESKSVPIGSSGDKNEASVSEIKSDSTLARGFLEGNTGDPDGIYIKLKEPMLAKQIWITGNNFHKNLLYSMEYTFSIANVKIRDPKGNNLALISRGAGVTVSSTSYGIYNDRYTQDTLWGPLQYDLGNKWVRLAVDNGSFMWCFVEHEKGKLEIDERADESITEAARNGVNIIMGLDFKGNWVYENPPAKVNWLEARFSEINDIYNYTPKSVDSSPEMFEGYLRYVDYMISHFKDRVTYFEIGNEWNRHPVDWYMRSIFEPTYEFIKKTHPDVKIMLGSPQFAKTEEFSQVLNCLGPGVTVKDGSISAVGKSLIAMDVVMERNVIVSVDSKSDAQAGIVLCFRDDKNFLAAIYDPRSKAIFFNELVDGYYTYLKETDKSDITQAGDMGVSVHLEAKLEGASVTFTVSDGKKTVSAKHVLNNITDGNGIGLIHYPVLPQSFAAEGEFKNFQVVDALGKLVYKDEFNNSDELDKVCKIFWNHLGDSNKQPAAQRVDAIGWHPAIFPDQAYFNAVRVLKSDCQKLGFNGYYSANEIYAGSMYPPGPPIESTDMEMAKYLLRSLVGHSGLNTEAGPCHPHFNAFPHTQALCRTTWPNQTIVPCQPTPAYYTWRNAATAMDDFYTYEFPVQLSDGNGIVQFTLKSGDEKQLMITAWLDVPLSDSITIRKTDITVKDINIKQAWVFDIFNGTQQEVDFISEGDNIIMKSMLIKDYPVIIRIKL